MTTLIELPDDVLNKIGEYVRYNNYFNNITKIDIIKSLDELYYYLKSNHIILPRNYKKMKKDDLINLINYKKIPFQLITKQDIENAEIDTIYGKYTIEINSKNNNVIFTTPFKEKPYDIANMNAKYLPIYLSYMKGQPSCHAE